MTAQMSVTGSRLIVLMTIIGLSYSLDCYTCDWNHQNDTMDDACLGAPYRTPSFACPKETIFGKIDMCQTHAEFEVKDGELNLVTLKRHCGVKHSKCNNECSDKSPDCWLCCRDNNNCNGFPLRGNLVVVSSGSSRDLSQAAILILTTSWLNVVLCFSG
ncbi:uncharacterized protein LOC127860041 [Dreissena polymorpha]|uniref:Uncharacterized protein n=1 Tax=Dreissena polymorpha TaxID=45954 RepID=A0A9D3YJ47_DREPO|nr:uncharacterized protein LOC127860041 [Dreissena polymorpha]KAH3699193.1 hypothetical protein DPMN_074147 [Dreissena polymorpha]